MLNWLTTWEGRRITKLRLKLWWHFKPFWYEQPYRVVLRFRRKSAPWPNYWAFVSLVQGQKPCEIGSVEQWSFSEAIGFAAEQYRRTLGVDDRLPKNEAPPAAPPVAGHARSIAMVPDSRYRVTCTCGWHSEESPKGHMCNPSDCAECRKIWDAFESHKSEVTAQ